MTKTVFLYKFRRLMGKGMRAGEDKHKQRGRRKKKQKRGKARMTTHHPPLLIYLPAKSQEQNPRQKMRNFEITN